jgi:hypothetical protein
MSIKGRAIKQLNNNNKEKKSKYGDSIISAII